MKEFGGPEVLEHTEVPDPESGDGEVIVDVARAGINYGDTHMTRNDYLAEQTLPLVPGGEVSGTAPDGRRVAALLLNGGYAEKVAVPEEWLVPLPDSVSDDQAAALLVQGLTAHALVDKCARLESGETVVVEAAAGGTGGLAVQIAKRAGAKVIGLASSEEKRKAVEELGADATVDSGISSADDLKAAILDANGGEQVDAVLHMSGGDAFKAELRALAPFGRIVAFGAASGERPNVEVGNLMRHSTAVIGFWLVHLIPQREEMAAMIGDLLSWAGSGELKVTVGNVYPLSEATRAHEDMTARRTTGKLLLDPSK